MKKEEGEIKIIRRKRLREIEEEEKMEVGIDKEEEKKKRGYKKEKEQRIKDDK